MTFRFAILSAVSSKQQAEGTSLEDQIALCRRVSERGWRESAGPYIVRGQNRTQYLNLRDAETEIPALRDLLEGARRRDYDVLVIYDHDRLRELLTLVYAALGDYGVQLFSVSAQNSPVPPDQYDPYENDTNDLLIGIGSLKSKSEIARMRRKYRTGMRNRILVYGLPVQIPYGYKRPLTEGTSRKVIPEPIPSLAPHLVHIKELYIKGKSLNQCIEYLEENRLPPPRGLVWHHQTVRDILKNPFYAGFVQFEKSKVRKDRRRGSRSRDRNIPAEKIITNQGKHTPLWSEADHRAVLAEMKRRTKNFRGRQNNQFTGIVHCGECDSVLHRFKNGPRSVPDRLIFRCSGNRYDHRAITHVDLLERVGALLATSLEPELRARETQVIETKAKTKDRSLLDGLRAERQRLENLHIKGLISIERFETLARDLDARIKNAEGETSGADVQAEQQESLLREIMRTLGSQAKHLPAWLARNDPGETNRILHLLFEKIILHQDGRVELVYK